MSLCITSLDFIPKYLALWKHKIRFLPITHFGQCQYIAYPLHIIFAVLIQNNFFFFLNTFLFNCIYKIGWYKHAESSLYPKFKSYGNFLKCLLLPKGERMICIQLAVNQNICQVLQCRLSLFPWRRLHMSFAGLASCQQHPYGCCEDNKMIITKGSHVTSVIWFSFARYNMEHRQPCHVKFAKTLNYFKVPAQQNSSSAWNMWLATPNHKVWGNSATSKLKSRA